MKGTTLARLEKLKEKKQLLDARIQKAEAYHSQKERKLDTRRKILLGSYYLDKAKKENALEEVKKIMDGYLARESDRKLFDLMPVNTNNDNNGQNNIQ